jgi:uncharacterized NAD-dependent epimerase/dehydratase family protein
MENATLDCCRSNGTRWRYHVCILIATVTLPINHEDMSDNEVSTAITQYEQELGIPTTDALTRPPERLVEMVIAAFPELQGKLIAVA